MKKHLTSVLFVVLLVCGIGLILYPTVSNYANLKHQSSTISAYVEKTQALNSEEYEGIWEQAQAYNAQLLENPLGFRLTDAEKTRYFQTLNVSGNGVMGYIQIPSIKVSLPIYHGTEETVLQQAVGHVEWTSLPVGGESSHCVLSGHRGLPSAKLFTNLDKLAIGDRFSLQILDKALNYEIDQILVVEPKDVEALKIVEGQDYCTLVTCTPYGINTHRLLVRGHRVKNPEQAVAAISVPADAVEVETWTACAVIALPMIIILAIIVFNSRKYRGKFE